MPRPSLRLVVVLAIAALGVAAVVLVSSGDESQTARKGAAQGGASLPKRLNLIVVMTDDQTRASFTSEVMPKTVRFFSRHGTVFEQAIAAPPLCCPARAAFLAGRYAHNTGVVDNAIGYRSMRERRATFPLALERSGYRTGLFGKFLHAYEEVGGAAPAPGFTRWLATYGYADYFNFEVSDDGALRRVADYSTDYFTENAISFARDAARDGEPFFAWLAYNAPHTVEPAHPPPCDGTAAQPPSAAAYEPFAGATLPQPASFNEADVADKPQLDAPRLGARKLDVLERQWRCSLAAMRRVDEQVGRLIEFLRRSGELERTVLVYLSDNGFYWGEHRLENDKRLPLEPALRIPFAVSVGGERGDSAATDVDELVSQVDLAPTLLDYAHVEGCAQNGSCSPFDGRSLRPLLEGTEAGWPEDRAIPLLLDDAWTYRALRTPSELLLQLDATRTESFEPPAVELYDLDADPDQLTNLAADGDSEDESRIEALAERLDRLGRCAGVEGRDRRTAGRPFCD